jgi:hypothetical protein
VIGDRGYNGKLEVLSTQNNFNPPEIVEFKAHILSPSTGVSRLSSVYQRNSATASRITRKLFKVNCVIVQCGVLLDPDP